MEKKLFLLAISAIMILASLSSESVLALARPVKGKSNLDEDWCKSISGSWQGKLGNKSYWYMVDRSTRLWWSCDGGKWEAVPNEMWADRDGRWMKIENHRVLWTRDSGKTWTEKPEWKWEGPDGKFYKFDQNWILWVKR